MFDLYEEVKPSLRVKQKSNMNLNFKNSIKNSNKKWVSKHPSIFPWHCDGDSRKFPIFSGNRMSFYLYWNENLMRTLECHRNEQLTRIWLCLYKNVSFFVAHRPLPYSITCDFVAFVLIVELMNHIAHVIIHYTKI